MTLSCNRVEAINPNSLQTTCLHRQTNTCNAVFEGGGVKGIAIAGAVLGMEQAGYQFKNMAGTSAGAIVAALVAAGYTGTEIRELLGSLNYKKFLDKSYFLGYPGKAINIMLRYGLYPGDYFTSWLDDLLKAKGISTFGDIRQPNVIAKYTYRFQAITSDISACKLLVLPGDLKYFGINPDTFNIARAVRMSMSIPLVFVPFRLKDYYGNEHLLVDGGVLSNYPIWLLDDETIDPSYPTFGFKLQECEQLVYGKCQPLQIKSLIGYLKNLLNTMLEAHDDYHVAHTKGDLERTIAIPTTIHVSGQTKAINATDFGISAIESDALFKNGLTAVNAFLTNWDFNYWKENYRELLRHRMNFRPPGIL
ncbi:MAG: putative esterase of the alpha-beta hydrolase superfamily [Firmicutes bacterium]|nr:putative esterase of the alpha-beta hydrolase superfamily [Bacillota bacterium]